MKDKIKFKECMAGLGLIFDKEISPALSKIYWKILEPFTDQECEAAFNKIISSCRFWPKPADFLEVLQVSESDRAMGAWLKVDKAMRELGNYQSIDFGDPAIHETIERMGGWDNLGMVENKDWIWKQKEFISIYNTIRRLNPQLGYVQGIIEKDNISRGCEEKVPLLYQTKSERPKLLQ